MRTNHLWFGDSWVIGAELFKDMPHKELNVSPKYIPNATFGFNFPNLAFPTTVSKQLQAKYWNFGMAGGSISFSLNQLYKFIKDYPNELTNDNVVFLCTTAQSRDFAQTTHDNVHYHQNIDRHAERYKTFFKDKMRPVIPFSEYESTKTINEFYQVCKMHNIKFYILNVWGQMHVHEETNLVPDECWLTEKTNNLFRLATGTDFTEVLGMPVKDGTAENEYQPIEFTPLYDHAIHKEYIAPCQFHPNLHCHTKMATTFLEIFNASRKI